MTTPVFAALADLVEEHYVLEELAPSYARVVRAHAAELDAVLPDHAAANARLHALVPDRHLALRPPPPGERVPARPSRRAGGVALVERRADNVAVVALRPTFGAPDEARPFLLAAAQHACGADALVLDLRDCGGGDTDTAALVHGWLLGPSPVTLGRFERRGMPPVDYVSDPTLGVWFPGPVAVLVSSRTFSGGEDLAYIQQALGRAVVVGSRTGGGAHPVEHFALPGGLTCQVPVARSVVAATGTNWEGTGVRPDLECLADEALHRALATLRTLPPRA